MTAMEKFSSKKFGVILFVVYVLWDMSVKQPDSAGTYVYLMCGMALFYSVLSIIDKAIVFKRQKEQPLEAPQTPKDPPTPEAPPAQG